MTDRDVMPDDEIREAVQAACARVWEKADRATDYGRKR